MSIGVRAHDFGKLPSNILAKKISEKGFSYIQLAISKALTDINYSYGKLNSGFANHIFNTFNKKNIRIAVLGCYINPVHPDKDDRKNQINKFKEHIRYAHDFGCSIVATETGSLNSDFSFHPDNHKDKGLNILLKSLDEIVNESEKFGVFVGIEGVHHYVASNPERMKRIIEKIDSNNLQVVFDPVNLLNINNYLDQKKIIEESFELFGDKINTFHAKDFIIKNNIFEIVQVGEGILDYNLIINLIKKRKPYIDFIMEGINLKSINKHLKFVKNLF